jgi:hypothetical protein
MAPSAVNDARRELAQLRSMIDDARRELGIEAKPAQIAVKRTPSRRRNGSSSTERRRQAPAA